MSEMSVFARTVFEDKYSHTLRSGRKEKWEETAARVAKNVMAAVDADEDLIKKIKDLISDKRFMPGGRYLYASGRSYHQVQNCALYTAEDSREGWSDLLRKTSMSLMTGAGVGAVYSKLRAKGQPIRKTGGVASGPVSLAQMVNDIGRGIKQGGSRRGAIWGGLHWNHPDIMDWIAIKDWNADIKAMKEKDFTYPAPLDGTNISVILDDLFFKAYENENHIDHTLARKVYWAVINMMLRNGEPGFSVDVGENAGEHNRNACTEIVSKDDSDICNLGALNIARFHTIEDFQEAIEYAVAFLIAGTVYSDVPHIEIDQTRTKNRRLGLGLMGVHEWLLQRGKKYGPDDELATWLEVYKKNSNEASKKYADLWSLSRPVKTRAIAPTGTIGIVAETTTGIEPVFCVAYKRRYWKNDEMHYQYVVDPTANRLIEGGMNPETIEDAYSLADDIERRVTFQAWVQKYVDHGISSTINLPSWGSELNNESKVRSFGNMLMKYLPQIRGITCYPDGSRGGQPLTPVKYSTAIKHVGEVFIEQADVCDIKGGSCGS